MPLIHTESVTLFHNFSCVGSTIGQNRIILFGIWVFKQAYGIQASFIIINYYLFFYELIFIYLLYNISLTVTLNTF